jgi:hypothetical protein
MGEQAADKAKNFTMEKHSSEVLRLYKSVRDMGKA